jgi:hypothetical protein
MKLRSILAGLAMAALAVVPASAQRGGPIGGPGVWELLGEERVGYGSDRDELAINQNENWWREKAFRSLRFVPTGGDVKIRRIILNYINGHSEQLEYQGTIRAGQQVDVPLRGERSYLKSIGFDYASKISFSLGSGGLRIGQATMRVYGENMRGGRPPERVVAPVIAPGARGNWDKIADESFDRRDSRVEMRVGRREGRLGQVRLLYNGDGGIVIREIRVRFGNGDQQTYPLAERLEDGYSTKGIDLEGDRRFVEQVTVILDPRGRPGRANFILEGTERPGREVSEPPRRGEGRVSREDWELLGRQTVGFGQDRDIIRVNQTESGWRGRGRGIDKVHFTAENNEVFMNSIRVTYLNGVSEEYRIGKLIPNGGDLAVDLPGERSFIREIEMSYRSRPGYRGNAVISVFAEKARR